MREPVVYGKDTKDIEPFKLISLDDNQKFALERAKKYALEQSIQNALKKQIDPLKSQVCTYDVIIFVGFQFS